MRLIKSLDERLGTNRPLAITIGNYDGVHLGHRSIFARLKDRAAHCQGDTAVISFTNHPLEILKPGTIVSRICSINHKIKLIEEQGIDYLILLPFTNKFSQQSPEEFLNTIQGWHFFRYLVLGGDAVFGKNREGDSLCIQKLAEPMGVEVDYLTMLSLDGVAMSSRQIRQWIIAGNFAMAERCLGRKYSLYSPLIQYDSKDKLSWGIDTKGLCLPPHGSYNIALKFDDTLYGGSIDIRETDIQTVTLKELNPTLVNGAFVEVIFT